MGGEVSTDFKSLNGIEISWLVQVLLNFDWFRGSPLGGGGGWMWIGGCERVLPTHMHTHMHACMCTCIWHHREFPGIPPMGGSHLHEIIMFTTCMCVCIHMCVHVCGGHCSTTPTPIHPLSHPRAAGSPKHQNSISLELIKIIRFCLKILYLWTFLNSYRL